MTPSQRAWVERRRAAAHDVITDAYWRFTRQARGVPPTSAAAGAYRQRALCDRLLHRDARCADYRLAGEWFYSTDSFFAALANAMEGIGG